MVKRMILVTTREGWLEADRIDSVPGHHSLSIPSYEGNSLCLTVKCQHKCDNAAGFVFDKQRFNTYGTRTGQDLTEL